MSYLLQQALGTNNNSNRNHNRNFLGGFRPVRFIGRVNKGLRTLGNYASQAHELGRYFNIDHPLYTGSMDVLHTLSKLGDRPIDRPLDAYSRLYKSNALLKSV